MLNYSLLTPWAETLDPRRILPAYPRPQLRRDSYVNLNGLWSYAINKTGDLSAPPDGVIAVPFPVESCLSGVGRRLAADEFLLYTRTVSLPAGFFRAVTLLHFGAVDQVCHVFVNGQSVGRHEGGYLPFTLDVTDAVHAGENTITLRVQDALSEQYPTGKQQNNRGGIWYTPVSGIWQTVWLESVPPGYVRDLRITPDLAGRQVTVAPRCDAGSFQVAVSAAGRVLAQATGTNSVTLSIPGEDVHPWSPEDPFLYDLTVTAGEDTVTSYFALRTFQAEGTRFVLNGKPYFVNGLLDQGYFSDGIYTPASYDAYRQDILTAKRLGFNALRKHIKLEPMQFYYLCDTLGMLVLQDMVNVGRYSFFKDTALPFAGLRKGSPYEAVNAKQRQTFIAHAAAVVRQLYNTPSVVYYTIFNEGWGQFDADGVYDLLRGLDPTRVFDATSGWFREQCSDVVSEHIYFKPIRLQAEAKPLIVSEFGGYSCSLPGHVFNTKKTFGYRKYRSLARFEDAFAALYETELLPAAEQGLLAGAVYTQVSDVEDETNGILTYDRRVCKLDVARIAPLMARLREVGSHA